MESCKKSARSCGRTALEVLASTLSGILVAVNLIFMFVMTILIVVIVLNITIAVVFQASSPVSVAASFGSVCLTVAFPWILAIQASIIDWSKWPISYRVFKRTLRLLWGLATPSPLPQNADEKGETTQEEKDEHDTMLMVRRIILYVLPFIIWIISSGVGLAGGSEVNTGTILFLVLAIIYILFNAFFDVVRFETNDINDSALLFILFGAKRGVFAMVALGFVFLTTVVNAATNSDLHSGAMATSFVLIIVNFGFHLGVYLSRTIGKSEFKARSFKTYIIAGFEIVSLIVSGSTIAVSFKPRDSIGIWVFVGFVIITYAFLVYDDVTVNLNDVTTADKETVKDVELKTEGTTAVVSVDEDARKKEEKEKEEQELKEKRKDVKEAANQNPLTQSKATSEPDGENSEEKETREEAEGKEEEEDEEEELKNDLRVGQRTTVKRISIVISTLCCLIVFAVSLIETPSDDRAVSCPGRYPGLNTSARFAVCELTLRGNFTISDFTSLALASYMTEKNFLRALSVYFPNETIDVVGGSEINNTRQDQFVAVRYWSVRFVNRSVSMVLGRGSFSNQDWKMDLFIGSEVVMLKAGMSLLPIFFNDDLLATLIDVLSAIKFGVKEYVDPVRNEVDYLKNTYPDDYYYIVGHSLAGWLSGIVAAQTGVDSVTFSPIGTGLQRKRYGFSKKVANEHLLSIVPAKDIVPKIDNQLGAVQNIIQIDENCNVGTCHDLGLTARSLGTNCGDALGRASIAVDEALPAGCSE